MNDELTFYARHFKLPQFEAASQDKLKLARVLIIGVGGLGCPVALYLAGAGVGHITLVDADTISVTNLHRQILFNTKDIGLLKVDVAKQKLEDLNPYICIKAIPKFGDATLLEGLICNHTLVIDCTDNFETKYKANDICEKLSVPLVYGSIFQYEGQVSVFHLKPNDSSASFSYRDVFPDAPPAGLSQNCGEAGVIGVLPGIIGTMQAAEVIKIITGIGEPLIGKMLVYDLLSSQLKHLKLSKRIHVKPNSKIDNFEIDFEVFEQMAQSGALLIDVRDEHESLNQSLGGINIPMLKLSEHIDLVGKSNSIVVYCKSGVRSKKAVLYLKSIFPEADIKSLNGGIDGSSCSF